MGLVSRTTQATATLTDAAGAVAVAAAGGVVGGISGAARGIADGLGLGSRSMTAAALTIVALGATGLVDWPVLVAVGGGALVLRQLRRGTPDTAPPKATAAAARTTARDSVDSTAPPAASQRTARAPRKSPAATPRSARTTAPTSKH